MVLPRKRSRLASLVGCAARAGTLRGFVLPLSAARAKPLDRGRAPSTGPQGAHARRVRRIKSTARRALGNRARSAGRHSKKGKRRASASSPPAENRVGRLRARKRGASFLARIRSPSPRPHQARARAGPALRAPPSSRAAPRRAGRVLPAASPGAARPRCAGAARAWPGQIRERPLVWERRRAGARQGAPKSKAGGYRRPAARARHRAGQPPEAGVSRVQGRETAARAASHPRARTTARGHLAQC